MKTRNPADDFRFLKRIAIGCAGFATGGAIAILWAAWRLWPW